MRSPSRRRFNPPVSLERHACSRKRSNITSRKKSPACSDRCRCLCTETFRGLNGRRVADFLDNQRQSLTREAQGLLQSEQFKVGVRHCCRPPLDPVSIAMPQGRRGMHRRRAPRSKRRFPLDSCPETDENSSSRVISPAAVAERRARSRPTGIDRNNARGAILLHSPGL